MAVSFVSRRSVFAAFRCWNLHPCSYICALANSFRLVCHLTSSPLTLYYLFPFTSLMTIQAETLEQRIAALEKGATFDATQAAIRQREEEMLATLRGIRAQMAEEAASGSGASSAEVTDLKEENAKLKQTVAKQEYRIRHLIAGMEDLLAAKKAAS